jgi:aspartate/methionine/tyrosine aminotransferase
LVLTDEVYEMLTFDGREHIHFATLAINWDRTVSIFSGGKLLNATGWKVGWAIGPQKLLHMGGVISNTVFYCFNTPG